MAERPELPLFVWKNPAEAKTPGKRLGRTRMHRRFAAAGLGVGLLIGSTFDPPLPRLVWNASASAPVGLYGVSPGAGIERGDMVIAWAPPAMRHLAAQRGYVPANVPLVKRVVAVFGDAVCTSGNLVSVNGRTAAIRRARDGAGRPMPWWHGCVVLRRDQYFLLMAGMADSFDGRYFGPSLQADIIGKATPLWVR